MGSAVSRVLRGRHHYDTTKAVVDYSGDSVSPKPASVCQVCWDGPLAEHLGLFSAPIQEPATGAASDSSTKTGGYSYTTTWGELKSRAAVPESCVWCQALLDMYELGRDDASREAEFPMEITVGSPTGPAVTMAGCTPGRMQELLVFINGFRHFVGYVYTDADDPIAPKIVARDRIQDVGSPRALTLARECLDECMHEHERCIALLASEDTIPGPVLPTRLIDCTNPACPRLDPSNGKRGQYLALSYVWGEAQEHKTTTLNKSTYERAIDPARLPKTIYDAIKVTHALGFAFLWVDSLCIVQDDDADKGRELGRMHRIYRDACVTIIASNAKKVSEGFLQDRPGPSRETVLPFLCPQLLPSPMPIRATRCLSFFHRLRRPAQDTIPVGRIRIAPTYLRTEGNIEQYGHAQEPISTRGWCLQEYMMSPRALLFTAETLQYRCPKETRNVGNAFYDPRTERRLPDALFLAEPPVLACGSREWVEVHEAWLDILEDYTRRAVTVPSDKLVACSAVAEAFQHVLRSEYLAGLWRDALPADLLWFKVDDAHLPRPTVYRAPSWSWAAVDGRVQRGGRGFMLDSRGAVSAEVVRCDVTLADSAVPFGQVSRGTLVVRSALIPSVLCTDGGFREQTIRLQSVDQARTWGADCDLSEREGLDADKTHEGMWFVDCESDAKIDRTWVVPLIRDGRSGMAGLVVARLDATESQTECGYIYRRLGIFCLVEEDEVGLCQALDAEELSLIEIVLV
ncbi:heterokaryon incompatibility protein-domain-containing protein [Trametes gibbosa]|nr:heterokaryon incompatibility protein-domain-containing protein [Trametes gibbosa]